MGGFKSGGLLLIFAIPMALYVAWTVNGVVRTDLVLSEPPADRGAPKEQLEASHKKVSNWAGDVWKAEAFFLQFRAVADGNMDQDAGPVIKESAARSADLIDLDLFLSGLESPSYKGKMKALYLKWMEERKGEKGDAEAVITWLGRPPAITSAAAATEAMNEALKLINTYARRSKFSDKSKAATWRVEARLRVINALKDLADAQYRVAVREKLPLKPGDNAVKIAVDTHRALQAQLADLETDQNLAKNAKVEIDATTRAEAESKGAIADECKAREDLLGVFSKDLSNNPGGVAAWLKQVAALYRRTKDEKVRTLIRDKMQEFCDGFIPAAARLDDTVLFKKKPIPRKDVVIEYEPSPGAKTKQVLLSGDVDGVNEFNVAKRYSEKTSEVRVGGAPGYLRDLAPTDLSTAAMLFNLERKKLADSTTVPKWSAKSVEELKKKCEAQKDLVDQLKTPDGVNAPKIWTRLSGLAAGMVGGADLFENGP